MAIVCLSANPALDRRLRTRNLQFGTVNRSEAAEAFPGGKAAHVAMAARALGAHAVWIGFLGGALGEECARGLMSLGIEVLQIRTKAPTRANLEIIEDSGRITEILEPGGKPDAAERAEMRRMCQRALREKWSGAILVISGSLPAGIATDFYPPLIRAARSAGSPVFLDTSGEALANGLKAGPDFVKPNRSELETLLKRKLRGERELLTAGRQLIERGAKSVAITMGAKGLIWIEGKKGRAWIATPPCLKPVVSTVGCGDTTIAGFAVARAYGLQGEAAVRFAAACGAANCLAAFEGCISKKDVESLITQIKTTEVE